jgi:hypothetical protein
LTRLFTRPVWLLGGVVTAVGAGIVLFVAVGSPQPGTIAPSSADWWSARLHQRRPGGIAARVGARNRGGMQAVMFGVGAASASTWPRP